MNKYMRTSMLSLTFLFFLIGVLPVSADFQKKRNQEKTGTTSVPETAARTPYSNVKRDELLNGLQIISLERSADPLVKFDLVIRAGAMFDLIGKTGVAKLTQETLLAVNPQLKEEFESLQATIEWGVDLDTTWFHIETPAESFESVLEIIARLLVVEDIRPEAFKSASQKHLELLKSRQPSTAERADENFFKALYGDHPYGHNIDGSDESISGIKQGDVYDYLKRFYLANNSSAVITGNISHARAMRIFRSYFGGWMKGSIVPRTFRPPSQVDRPHLVKIEESGSAKIEIRSGLIGVKHNDPDFLVTRVIAGILAARLQNPQTELSVKSLPRNLPGPLFVSASVPVDQAVALSGRINESFASLTTAPVSGEQLASIKSGLTAEYASRPTEFFLREIEVYSLPRNYPLNLASKLDSITAADVQRVAKKLLDANALTVIVQGDVKEIFKSNH
jgi:zinc protease